MPMESEATQESEDIENRIEDSEQSESHQPIEPSNGTRYLSQEKTEYSRETKSNQKKVESKKSNLEGLESLVRKSVAEAKAIKVDPTEYLSGELARNPVQYSESVLTKTENASDEEKSTNKAAVVIIYNKDTKEFYLEEKSANYSITEARGKLSLVGGEVERKDCTTLDAAIREITEEVGSMKAQKIIINKLTQLGSYYDTVIDFDGGSKYETFIYKVNIDNKDDWNIVKNAPLVHDAGPKRILTIDEILSKPDSDFAFHYGPTIKKFILEEFADYRHSLHNWTPDTFNFMPNLGASCKYSQTVNSGFNNQPLISINS